MLPAFVLRGIFVVSLPCTIDSLFGNKFEVCWSEFVIPTFEHWIYNPQKIINLKAQLKHIKWNCTFAKITMN